MGGSGAGGHIYSEFSSKAKYHTTTFILESFYTSKLRPKLKAALKSSKEKKCVPLGNRVLDFTGGVGFMYKLSLSICKLIWHQLVNHTSLPLPNRLPLIQMQIVEEWMV